MTRRTVRPLAMLGTALLLTGCATMHEVFPEAEPHDVWTALVAVARTPNYRDPDPDHRWRVKQNAVSVDARARRIEIYRELDRILHRPGTSPLREHRTWRLRITFNETYPPTAGFLSRGWELPMHARSEADRYFGDVHALLASDLDPRVSLSARVRREPPDQAYEKIKALESSER